ncbi:MAG TPA: sugar ABC transporter substrate-binding protein [Xanthobacteraceae bacterium]|jgi:ABC-type sugar transport system substrate-binding protein
MTRSARRHHLAFAVLALTALTVAPAWAAGKQTVGIAGAVYAIEAARAQYESAAAVLMERGIAVKYIDAQQDINKQVAAVDQFVDEKVDAIIVQVVGDPNALLRPFQRAEKAGIKVFSLGPTPGFPGTLIEYDDGADNLGRASGEWMCKATGGEGDIAMIEAIEIPVLLPRWNVFLETIKAKCPKLKVVAIERAVPDDAATARPIAENLLTRFPNLKAIWAMGDGPALGAGLAAKAAGRKIIVTGINGEVVGIDGVKQGVINATWDMQPTDIGSQLGAKVADILQGKAPVPAKTEVFDMGGQVEWTTKNAGDWKPYDKRVKYPGLQ